MRDFPAFGLIDFDAVFSVVFFGLRRSKKALGYYPPDLEKIIFALVTSEGGFLFLSFMI